MGNARSHPSVCFALAHLPVALFLAYTEKIAFPSLTPTPPLEPLKNTTTTTTAAATTTNNNTNNNNNNNNTG